MQRDEFMLRYMTGKTIMEIGPIQEYDTAAARARELATTLDIPVSIYNWKDVYLKTVLPEKARTNA